MKKRENKGEVAFQEYYNEIFQDRWDILSNSLLKEEKKFPRVHGEELTFDEDYLSILNRSLEVPQSSLIYYMDFASILVGYLLPLNKGGKVLDMCAAPGGKSLILAGRVDNKTYLELNEISPNRRFRLKNVLKEYGEENNSQIKVTGFDGMNYGLMRKDEFDSILLDAPCSSERHVMNSPKHLSQWSLKRPKQLSKKQYGLLCSAILACKASGHIVYSTCALTPLENDEVIRRVLEKKGETVEHIKIPEHFAKFGEATEFGLRFLPDQNHLGPMYVSLLRKKG